MTLEEYQQLLALSAEQQDAGTELELQRAQAQALRGAMPQRTGQHVGPGNLFVGNVGEQIAGAINGYAQSQRATQAAGLQKQQNAAQQKQNAMILAQILRGQQAQPPMSGMGSGQGLNPQATGFDTLKIPQGY